MGPQISKGPKLKKPNMGPMLGPVFIQVQVQVHCIDSRNGFASMNFMPEDPNTQCQSHVLVYCMYRIILLYLCI